MHLCWSEAETGDLGSQLPAPPHLSFLQALACVCPFQEDKVLLLQLSLPVQAYGLPYLATFSAETFLALPGGGVPQSWATPSLSPRNLLAASKLSGTASPLGQHHKMLPLGRGPLDPCPLALSWQWFGIWVLVCVCMQASRESLPLYMWVWLPSFKLEGGSCVPTQVHEIWL